MRTFHIRVDAKIQRKRWNNDDEILTEHDWSAELECDGVDKLGRILELNHKKNLHSYQLPDLIAAHIQFDHELDFDDINDIVLSIHTKTIRELG